MSNDIKYFLFLDKLRPMEDLNKHKTFGEHLRMLREKSGLTLKDVAINLNIDISFLAKIERNERKPSKQFIKNIASFFNVKEEELLMNYLSDQIAYRILEEDADINILKVAEEKIKYGVIKQK